MGKKISNLVINTNDYENACCGTCKHNKECKSYLNHKERTNWICGMYQNGGSAIKQLNLFEEDYNEF